MGPGWVTPGSQLGRCCSAPGAGRQMLLCFMHPMEEHKVPELRYPQRCSRCTLGCCVCQARCGCGQAAALAGTPGCYWEKSSKSSQPPPALPLEAGLALAMGYFWAARLSNGMSCAEILGGSGPLPRESPAGRARGAAGAPPLLRVGAGPKPSPVPISSCWGLWEWAGLSQQPPAHRVAPCRSDLRSDIPRARHGQTSSPCLDAGCLPPVLFSVPCAADASPPALCWVDTSASHSTFPSPSL